MDLLSVRQDRVTSSQRKCIAADVHLDRSHWSHLSFHPPFRYSGNDASSIAEMATYARRGGRVEALEGNASGEGALCIGRY
jgi:hypothetical protein